VVERTALTLEPEHLIEELRALIGDDDPARVTIAFDGDGTLWSGDVGEDLMHAALRESFLLEAALPSLLAEAQRHAIPLPNESEPNAVADTLIHAYLAGTYPERETCAMMTWCYAGRSLLELSEFAAAVLRDEDLPSRLSAELAPIIEWCDAAGVRRVLVSASPRVIVEQAAAARGFRPENIAAAKPAVAAGRVLPHLDGAVPYAEAKLSAGRALFGDARWLAAFGDNVFDIEMLTTAEVGIAVRPKPKLEQQLAALGLRRLTPRG
jgi:phosphatidylglycerophosphatase C